MKKIIFLMLTLAFPSLAAISKKLNKAIPFEESPDVLSYSLLLKKFEKYENEFTIKNAYFQNECDRLGHHTAIELKVIRNALNGCFEFSTREGYWNYTMLVCNDGRESFRILANCDSFNNNSKTKKKFRKIVVAAVISMPHSKELD